MITDETIKKTVEGIIGKLPMNLQSRTPAEQIPHLQKARDQVDGISWLLVTDQRWRKSGISDLIEEVLDDLDARIDSAYQAKIKAKYADVIAHLGLAMGGAA